MTAVLGWSAGSVTAQEAACAPVEVGEDTGVYFLALGETCGAEAAEGYTVVARLARDDDGSELLVLIDSQHLDAETMDAAQVLVNAVMDGTVDEHTWHPVDEQ